MFSCGTQILLEGSMVSYSSILPVVVNNIEHTTKGAWTPITSDY